MEGAADNREDSSKLEEMKSTPEVRAHYQIIQENLDGPGSSNHLTQKVELLQALATEQEADTLERESQEKEDHGIDPHASILIKTKHQRGKRNRAVK